MANRGSSRAAAALGLGALLAVWAAVADAAAAEELTGRAIVDRAVERHESPAEYEEQRWVLTDRGGATEERRVRRYFRDDDDEGFRLLLVVDEPAGVRGVALLSWERPGAANDQWQYLPAAGRGLMRIAEGGRRNLFLGTDFAFEDLLPEQRDKFRYQREADETVDGVAYRVVSALPESEDVRRSTGYARRVLFVRRDNDVIARIDYHDRRGQLLKRQTLEDLAPVDGDGGAWRARVTTMENLRTGHATRVETTARRLEAEAAPEAAFQHRFITSGRYLRR